MTSAPPIPSAATTSVRPVNGVTVLSEWIQRHRRALGAISLFVGFAVYYGICLYPGVGGVLNTGDSAKFQVLAHAPIMVHGPGYPFYLLIASAIRAMDLPLPGWWQITFLLSAVPGALATAFAFLIVERVTESVRYGVAAALLLGSAHLMTIQATEAEVYALNIAFVLAAVYLLVRFIESERLSFFVGACAVYAISFGNHLMMVMLLPLFVGLTAIYYRSILQPKVIAAVAAVIALGASQYLYLAYVAHDPSTAYSEYMPLPPSTGELVDYIWGAYFSDLYGSGLDSSKTLEELVATLEKAHPWVSVPLLAAGAVAFVGIGGRRVLRDAAWSKVAIIFAGAICFLPFMLWYGPGDIEAFHLPLLALALLAAVASLGVAAMRERYSAVRYLAPLLILIGIVRLVDTGERLTDREADFDGIEQQIGEIVARVPSGEDRPILALGYGARMAAMYHFFAGDLPEGPDYRLSWKMPNNVRFASSLHGAVMPGNARHFVERAQELRPDLRCRVEPLETSGDGPMNAFAFRCASRDTGPFIW